MAEKLIYSAAKKREELEGAFRLVFREYSCRKYIPKGLKSDMRLSFYNALPTTTTFIAKRGKKVVATLTLICDTPIGLPMDKLYRKELDTFRRKKLRIAEVSQFAVSRELYPPSKYSMFNFGKLIFIFRLFKILLDFARNIERIDRLCITIHPKHKNMYKFLAFRKFGKKKAYDVVNKAPAVGLFLDIGDKLEREAKKRRGIYKIFFGSTTHESIMRNKFIFTVKDLEYFFIKRSNLFEKLTARQVKYLRNCFPRKTFDKLISKRAR